MRFQVVGANSESGDDVDVLLEGSSQAEVEQLAHDKGILVATITLKPDKAADDGGAIALVDDDMPLVPPAAADHALAVHTNGAAAQAPAPAAAAAHAVEHKHGMITTNANSPSDSVHTAEGHVAETHKGETPMEYHILMNQALYLLETAVNKYLRDGWEPQGGLTVGVSNNAMQYFQALSRRKKA